MKLSAAASAGLQYFGWVFGAGFVLGLIRVPLLVPRLGERWAELLEMPLMLAVIWFAARRIVQRHSLEAGEAIAAGGLALALLLAAEAGLVVGLRGITLTAYIEGRDPVAGSVYALMLIVYAAMPWIVARGASARR